MITLDDRPAPPPLPRFSQDMAQFLIAAARARTVPATRRRGRQFAAGVAAAAAAAAVAVGIYAATTGSSPPSGTHQPSIGRSSTGGVHIHLAAFSVDTNPGGTVTLTLTHGQLFDPSAVRAALARAGVPAVVTVGSACTVPGRPSNGLPQVISSAPAPNGQDSVTVITPAAIPAGEELSFGYFAVGAGGGHLFVALVPTGAKLTCSATPPGPPHSGSGTSR